VGCCYTYGLAKQANLQGVVAPAKQGQNHHQIPRYPRYQNIVRTVLHAAGAEYRQVSCCSTYGLAKQANLQGVVAPVNKGKSSHHTQHTKIFCVPFCVFLVVMLTAGAQR
jgi:hypothetical protein